MVTGWSSQLFTDTIDRQDGVENVLCVQVLCIGRGHGIDTWYVSPWITAASIPMKCP
ncbi:uncharacterized protein ASPGLDRAFT_480881 [Aspergillus glaucus CBS 516.65]|uniref:Uncharacterized protein n=1 Tax=Aspergillus glaucus CBS 516.65 TaxID=1160497 RepID=A0A1L9VF92_ASPGL|nr:hypothetical protein ASPGLDRAFT_480881 [Aspergillus glaucus CBS 516.65]OJJ82621.1 hypothetical protein ASPGLDRAFT_480881 [Aspergillus glaucus CBS 516.65]